MLIQKKYHEIREQIQDGDIIAFGGKGLISNLIKAFTFSVVSHIGIIWKGKDVAFGGKIFIRNDLIESTSLEGFSGVVVNRLSKRLKDYDGDVWWLPLSNEIRNKINFTIFYDWLKKQRKKEYDSWQAINSALDLLPDSKENFDKIYCAELDAGALEISGGIPDINCSEILPIELCRWNIYKDDHYQLSGEPKEITRYNSIKVGNWVL